MTCDTKRRPVAWTPNYHTIVRDADGSLFGKPCDAVSLVGNAHINCPLMDTSVICDHGSLAGLSVYGYSTCAFKEANATVYETTAPEARQSIAYGGKPVFYPGGAILKDKQMKNPYQSSYQTKS